MNSTREIKRMDTGILVATLTPEEEAKMDELIGERRRIRKAQLNANHDAKQARQKLILLKKQWRAVTAELLLIQRIRFPEL